MARGPWPRRGPARRACRGPRHARTNRRQPGLAHRPLSGRRRADPRARAPTPRGQNAGDHHRRRDHQQSEEHRRSVSAVGDGVRHRRKRIGQELAVGRDARPGVGAPAWRHRPEARPAHEPPRREPNRQGGADRPVAHRPHAAQQSGHVHRRVRRDSQGVRQHPRRQAARLQGRPLQFQRQGRAVRRVSGPRAAADRDELPARSLRRVPRVRRKTVQPPDARHPLPRPLDRRRARHAGGRSGRVLRELSRDRPARAQLAGGRAWAT